MKAACASHHSKSSSNNSTHHKQSIDLLETWNQVHFGRLPGCSLSDPPRNPYTPLFNTKKIISNTIKHFFFLTLLCGHVSQLASLFTADPSPLLFLAGFFGGGTYRAKIEQGVGISAGDVDYASVFNEHYFDAGASNKLFDISPQYGTAVNPITKKIDHFLALGLTSKLDGDGLAANGGRPPTRLVICLDTSGSMGSRMGRDSNQSKMDVAKECLLDMLQHLRPGVDSLGLVQFVNTATVVWPLQKWDESQREDFVATVQTLRASGGTNLEAGMRASADLFGDFTAERTSRTFDRIFYLTDMCPNLGLHDPNSLFSLALQYADHSLFTTFAGIGLDFQSATTRWITTSLPGASFIGVHSPKEFRDFLVTELNFNLTPIILDARATASIEGDSRLKIKAAYGAPEHDDHDGKEQRPATEGSLDVVNMKTIFPSSKNQRGETRGALVLLELDAEGAQDLRHDAAAKDAVAPVEGGDAAPRVAISVEYSSFWDAEMGRVDRVVKESADVVAKVPLEKQGEGVEESGALVRKGVALVYYVKVMRKAAEKEIGIGEVKEFLKWFETEKEALGDDSMKTEVDMLKKTIEGMEKNLKEQATEDVGTMMG